jgi:hypothetical protein
MFIQKALHASLQKAPPPFADGVFMDAQFGGNYFAG